MAGVILYCRAGFENDTANEIQQKAAELDIYGFVKLNANSGYVQYQCYNPEDAFRLIKQLPLDELVFARQFFAYSQHLQDLDPADRIGPIIEASMSFPGCGELRVEYPDTTDGRELSRFCKKFTVPLRQALRKTSQLSDKLNVYVPVMHVFFVDGRNAYVGYSFSNNNSPLPLGIMRLKFPNEAPSRSTLKLEEAIHVFLDKEEQELRFKSGMNAVDLGACPGGWTYQLVKRGLFVQAIDNGAMAGSLMESGQVKHFEEDGFKFRPKKKNVHWLVCDMIEKPDKVARLMARWLRDGDCKEAIFNLKLPMKRRFESYLQAVKIIDDELQGKEPVRYSLKAKHLYHDREEITVHLRAF